jgi:hypothetical protein
MILRYVCCNAATEKRWVRGCCQVPRRIDDKLRTTGANLWNKSCHHNSGVSTGPISSTTHSSPRKRATSCRVIVTSPKGEWMCAYQGGTSRAVCRWGRSRTQTASDDPADKAHSASGPLRPTALVKEALLRVACSRKYNRC